MSQIVLVASRMDKAVDVVAERLNDLGASHMALRAGRLNYQRQLSEELNNLLSQPALDDGVEDMLLLDTKDMKDHLDGTTNCKMLRSRKNSSVNANTSKLHSKKAKLI